MTAIAWILLVSLSAATPVPPKAPQPQAKVWTSEDVEALRATGGITTFDVPTETETVPVPETLTPPKEKDPAWYREQVESRRNQLAQVEAEITRYRRFLNSGQGGYSGLRLGEDNVGITPESSVWLLENRARQLRSEISDLEDLARRNSIASGFLR